MKKVFGSPVYLIVLFIILGLVYREVLSCGAYLFGGVTLAPETGQVVWLVGFWLWILLLPLALVISLMRLVKAEGRKEKTGEFIIFLFVLGFCLLVSMAFTSLSTARTHAREASVMASMSTMRLESESHLRLEKGELIYGQPTNSCHEPGSIFAAMSPLIVAVEGKVEGNELRCFSTSDAWSVSAAIPKTSRGGLFCPAPPALTLYCVDSSGAAHRVSQLATGPVCPPAVR
jgi:hypothetical protein